MADSGKVRWVWIVLGVILAALVACAVGTVAGGVTGYALGRRATGNMPMRILRDWQAPIPTPQPAPAVPWGPLEYGALIANVVEGSPAAEAGLQAGDVISAVDGEAMGQDQDLAEIIRAHKPGDTVSLRVTRSGDALDLSATLGRNPASEAQVAWLGIEFRLVPLGLGPDLRIMPGTN